MHEGPLTYFQVIPNFDAQSRNGAVCSFSGLPKQEQDTPQKQEHEVDEFILRGPEIEFEGYLDIRPAVIYETALQLGMVHADEYAAVEAQADALVIRLIAAETALEAAEDRLKQMILVNAEQITQEEALHGELTQAYEDLYDPVELVHLVDEKNQQVLLPEDL